MYGSSRKSTLSSLGYLHELNTSWSKTDKNEFNFYTRLQFFFVQLVFKSKSRVLNSLVCKTSNEEESETTTSELIECLGHIKVNTNTHLTSPRKSSQFWLWNFFDLCITGRGVYCQPHLALSLPHPGIHTAAASVHTQKGTCMYKSVYSLICTCVCVCVCVKLSIFTICSQLQRCVSRSNDATSLKSKVKWFFQIIKKAFPVTLYIHNGYWCRSKILLKFQ